MSQNQLCLNLAAQSPYFKVAMLEIKFKPTSNGKVTVKGKRINSGRPYGLDISHKYTFQGHSFLITLLKNKLSKTGISSRARGKQIRNSMLWTPWFCTAVHCWHLERINHNERLIISISFVIAAVIMDRFLNTIRHKKIPNEKTCRLGFPFKGGIFGWPLNTGNNYGLCLGKNSGLWRLAA